jgi:hypothetical protein
MTTLLKKVVLVTMIHFEMHVQLRMFFENFVPKKNKEIQ